MVARTRSLLGDGVVFTNPGPGVSGALRAAWLGLRHSATFRPYP